MMNKRELAAALAERAKLSKDQAANVVDELLAIVIERMRDGEEVRLAGFGNFSVKNRPARIVTPPGQKEPREVPASKAPKFTAAKAMKDQNNGS